MRALKNADWYDNFSYQFRSDDCSHEKQIMLANSNWRTDFTLRRLKRNEEDSNKSLLHRYRVERKLNCEKCITKHWFYIDNRKEFNATVMNLRLEYFLRTFVIACLASIVLLYLIDYFYL